MSMGSFLRPGEQIIRCMSCGRVMITDQVPEKCPVCGEKGEFRTIPPERY